MVVSNKLPKKSKGPVTYSCPNCPKYWEPIGAYLNNMGEEISYIRLFCPSCKRTEERFW